MKIKKEKTRVKVKIEYTAFAYNPNNIFQHQIILYNNFNKIRLPRKEIFSHDIREQNDSLRFVLSYRKAFLKFKKRIHSKLLTTLKEKLLPMSKSVGKYSWKVKVAFYLDTISNQLRIDICTMRKDDERFNLNIILENSRNFKENTISQYQNNLYGSQSFLNNLKTNNFIFEINLGYSNLKYKYPFIHDLKQKEIELCNNFFKVKQDLIENYNFSCVSGKKQLSYSDLKIIFIDDFYFYLRKNKDTSNFINIRQKLNKSEYLVILAKNDLNAHIFDGLDIKNLSFEQIAEQLSIIEY